MALGGYVYRAFRSNRRRNLLGVAAVVVTVWLMVLVGVLFNSAMLTFTGIFTREAGFDVSVTPSDPAARNLTNISYFEVAPVEEALLEGGAEDVHPLIAHVMVGAPVEERIENGSLLVLYGAEEDYDAGEVLELEGDYDLSGEGCVLSREAAEDMEVGVGDELQLLGFRGDLNFTANLTELMQDPDFKDKLFLEYWTVRGVVDLQGRFLGGVGSYLVKDLSDVQALYGVNGSATTVVASVDFDLYDLNDPEDPAGRVIELVEGIALDLGPDYAVTAPRAQLIEASMEASRATNVIAYLFSVVFPVISGIMIASILNLSVEERAKDLATMRLLGARRRMVGRVVMGELGLMLAVGIPIGVALGVGMPLAAQSVGVEELPEEIGLVVDWGTVTGQIVITLVITTLFALAPLRKAMATSPAEVISQVRTEGRYRFVRTRGVDRRMLVTAFAIFLALLYGTFFIPYFLIYGGDLFFTFFIFSFLVILLMYCVFILAAVPGLQRALVALMRPLVPRTRKLVRASLERYIRRNASTTLIFAIIVAILLFFSTFFAALQLSIESTTRYEVGSEVRVGAPEGLPPEVVDGVRGANYTDQVTAATPDLEGYMGDVVGTRTELVDLLAVDGSLLGATFVEDGDVYRGDLATLDDLEDDECAISRAMAEALEVDLGDTVAVELGEHRLFMRVVLVLEAMPGYLWDFPERPEEAWGSGAFVTLETYALLAGVPVGNLTYDMLFVTVPEDVKASEAARQLQQRYRVYFTFNVIVTEDIVREVEAGLEGLNTLFFVILVILLFVAFFSLYMNLLASILEREFELGIVRSLGLRASQLRNSLIAEGVATATVAMALGVVVGVTLSALVIAFFNMLSPVDFGFSVPWSTLGVLVALTLLFSLGATYPPSRRVSRRAVVDLIRRAT